MNLARRAGRLTFFKNKGNPWIEMLRQWMLPVLGGGASLKYVFRDLEPWQAIAATVSIAVVSEIAAAFIGWAEYASGATEEHYRMATKSDPHRRDSLRLLEEQRILLEELRGLLEEQKVLLEALLAEVRRRQVVMVRLPEPPRPPGPPPA